MSDEVFEPNPDIVRLFPLSGVVLFPHGVLPLHIFEERYKQLMRHALADDRAVTMVLPTTDDTEEPVPIHSIGCLGQICDERELPDGRFLFVLRGLHRVKIQHEVDVDPSGDILYRQASYSILEDNLSNQLSTRRQLQRAEIVGILQRLLPKQDKGLKKFFHFLAGECNASIFSDIVSYAAPINTDSKQQLLDTIDVDHRLELLVESLRQAVGKTNDDMPTDSFPPTFSSN